jgi:hypothetical protein
MTLTQALKENMGDPERRTCTVRFATSPKKKKRKSGGLTKDKWSSFQEVGLSHSSDEIPVMGMERRAWVISVTDK